MTEIKVFKIDAASTQLTANELRVLFDQNAQSSKIDKVVWDVWYDMELTGSKPAVLVSSDIQTIQIKNLVSYAIYISDDNPHLTKTSGNGIPIQHDKDLNVIDSSFKEYRVPANTTFHVVGLQLWWRKYGGDIVPKTDHFRTNLEYLSDDELINSGAWTNWHPNGSLMATKVIPLPLKTASRFMLDITTDKKGLDKKGSDKKSVDKKKKNTSEKVTTSDELNSFVDEINETNTRYLMNESLLYKHINSLNSVVAIPTIKKMWTLPSDSWMTVDPLFIKKVQPYVIGVINDIFDIKRFNLMDLYLSPSERYVMSEIERLKKSYEEMKKTRAQIHASYTLMMNKTRLDLYANELAGKNYLLLNDTEKNLVNLTIQKKKDVDAHFSTKYTARIKRAFELADTNTTFLNQISSEIIDESGLSWAELVKAAKKAADKKDDALSLSKQIVSKKLTICPHQIQLIDMTLKAKPNEFNTIDLNDLSERIAKVWAGHFPINYKYYCSLCGELLMTENLSEFLTFNQTIISSSDKDPIWYLMTSELNQVLRRVKFNQPTNTKVLINSIADIMETELVKINTELQKSKTRSMIDAQNIFVLNISAYCYAFISKMIIDNFKNMQWYVSGGSSSGGRAPAKKVVSKAAGQKDALKILSEGLYLFVETNQTRLAKIKEFGNEKLKPMFLSSYEWAKTTTLVTAKETKVVDVNIMKLVRDAKFNLIYNVQSILSESKDMPTAKSKDRIDYTDFKKLLGNDNPFIALSSDTPYKDALRKVPSNEYMDNYIAMLDYTDKRVFDEVAVPRSSMLSDWYKKLDTLRSGDAVRRHERILSTLRPTLTVNILDGSQMPEYDIQHISKIQCFDGHKHDFSMSTGLYLYKGKKPMPLSEVVKLKKTGSTRLGKVMDMVCSRCGMYENGKLQNLESKLSEVISKDNFYKHFEHICPLAKTSNLEDIMHDFPITDEFVGNNACKRCGFKRSYIENAPNDYYTKYKKLMPKHDLIREVIDYVPPSGKGIGEAPTLKKFDKWKVTNFAIRQISTLSQKMTYHSWNNLGLTEKKNFGHIASGDINPQDTITEDESAARLSKLEGFLRWIQTQYLLIRNSSSVDVPIELKTLISENMGIVSESTTFAKLLPDILPEFSKQLAYYKKTQTAKVNCNFVLHNICFTLTQINDMNIKKLAGKIFEYMVNYIYRSELIMSELEVRKVQVVETSDDDLSDVFDEFQPENVMVDKEIEDPFSLEGVDIETSNTGNDEEEFMD